MRPERDGQDSSAIAGFCKKMSGAETQRYSSAPQPIEHRQMPATGKDLFARLDALGIAYKTFEHIAVFTVEESRAACANIPGAHTKNLFLKDRKDGLWLVVAREELRIDLHALAKQMGVARFSFGSGDLLVETLGVQPGSVTPFSLINDTEGKVRVVLDEGMMKLDPLNFHPLRNDRTTAVSAANLLKFIRDTGHAPQIVALPERAP